VPIEHAVAMQRALPDSQLAVVPGTSHALPMEKPDLANRLLLDFLATEQVPKMLVLSDSRLFLTGDTSRPNAVASLDVGLEAAPRLLGGVLLRLQSAIRTCTSPRV
jgi:hypothetical protein